MTADTIPVEQVDRIAAADLIVRRPMVENPDIILHGGADDGAFVQAFARHRVRARTEADRSVREALEAAVDWLKSAPLESGMCCCGNPVEGHGYGDGHSPVDDLAYSAGHLQERLVAALKGSNPAVNGSEG